ncbi:GPI transamidase component PIG-S [Pleurostoma richardsiae]|uniref:GPI transamidase component PIG-S n=1 Tax=Pleurostoma richardsiae TaxID=41990 RepID=A0AA38RXP9_9PEZI|nr:GPI transamidase component PIG-S [Pleurostoma richardsiae]
MLPEPSLSFTLPSLHDATTLDCRVYHPRPLITGASSAKWRKRGAVVAHPYAPLGGCYDDPVVDVVAATLVRAGFVVATFNFRGAGKSTGRTSWTSKPERNDYMTVAGFLAYYVHHLDTSDHRPGNDRPAGDPPQSPLSDGATTAPQIQVDTTSSSSPSNGAVLLLLAGYSYGAMITAHLPPFETMLSAFADPQPGSPTAEVRMRARRLARQQSAILAETRARSGALLAERQKSRSHGDDVASLAQTSPHKSPRKALGTMRVGGDEDRRARKSHESFGRRSFSLEDAEDRLRKGVGDLLGRHSRREKSGKEIAGLDGGAKEDARRDIKEPPSSQAEDAEQLRGVPDDLAHARVAYLLVSPPIGWATSLMTLTLPPLPFGRWSAAASQPHTSAQQQQQPPSGDVKTPGAHHQHHQYNHHPGVGSTRDRHLAEAKLASSPTLAVYGDADVFAAVRRLRAWAGRLRGGHLGSRFRAVEVPGAGHFYIEEGTMGRLRDAVKAFAEGLARGEGWE